MSVHDQQDIVKLDLLRSLARSQRALTRMLESMADSLEASRPLSRQFADHLEVIGRYQKVLTLQIMGLRIKKRRRGVPAPPWINPRIAVQGELQVYSIGGFTHEQNPETGHIYKSRDQGTKP